MTNTGTGPIAGGTTGMGVGAGLGPSKYKHEHDLEHSLHQLLHRVYHNSFQHPLPHPVYAPMGMSKRRRLAGPEGMDRNQVYTLYTHLFIYFIFYFNLFKISCIIFSPQFNIVIMIFSNCR